MDLEMVLNELSLEPLASSVPQARQRMIDFLDTTRIAIKLGAKGIIRTSDDINSLLLAPDYPVVRWSNDNEVDREKQRFFRTQITKSPYLKDIEDTKIEERNERIQFFYQGVEAQGLGAAYLLEALALSFRSAQCWEQNNLELTLLELDEEGELQEDASLKVTHACCVEHVQQHEHWITERIQFHAQLSVSDGNDLWAHKEAFFPNLLFCDAVQKQLRGILRGNILLYSIKKKLCELNTYCENWQGGLFDYNKIPGKITPESDATLGKYPNEHTFLCPDGVSRLFSWHARLTPGAWRIYFSVDDKKRLLTIGHIGHKLPNMSYPT